MAYDRSLDVKSWDEKPKADFWRAKYARNDFNKELKSLYKFEYSREERSDVLVFESHAALAAAFPGFFVGVEDPDAGMVIRGETDLFRIATGVREPSLDIRVFQPK